MKRQEFINQALSLGTTLKVAENLADFIGLHKKTFRISVEVEPTSPVATGWNDSSWGQVLFGVTKNGKAGTSHYRNAKDSAWSQFFDIDLDSIRVERE